MSILDGFLDGVNVDQATIGTGLQAIGAGLLSGNRYQPLGPGFSQTLALAQKAAPREAWEKLLLANGFSPEEAKAYSASEGTAKAALQQRQLAKLNDTSDAPPLDGSAGAPAATPSMVPPAPGGPAAGASLNGDAAGSFLNTLIGKESGGNPNAKNPGSSATGLTQFTDGTWREMMRLHPELGLTPNGRTDPEQAKKAALAYAQDNGKLIAENGHPVTPGNLYLGHFLGGPGATRFLNGMRQNPDAPASSYADPSAVAANRTVFFNRDGSPKSARDFYNERTSRFGNAPSSPVQVAAGPRDPAVAADDGGPLTPGLPQPQPQAPFPGAPQALRAGVPSLALQPPPAEIGVPDNILNSPMRQPAQVAGASPADVPAADAQNAGFVIPPGADPKVRAQDRALGAPPPGVPQNTGEDTQRAFAIRNFEYWAKKLRVAGAAGDLGKGVAEEAKIRLDLAKEYLKPTEAERLARAAGLKGEDFTAAVSGAIPGNAPTSTQKEYASYRKQTIENGEVPISQLDYDLKLRQAGKTEVNIKNDAEKKEEVERAASVTKFLSGVADSAPATARRASDLDMLGRLVSRTRTAQGTTLRATLDGVGKELGLSSGELKTKADAINAIVNRLAPQMREPGTGTVSDADLRGFLAALPSLSATPEGNQLILGALKRATDVDRERTRIAAQWQAGKVSAADARSKIADIDERSIYASDAERQLVAGLSPIPEGKTGAGWRIIGVE